MSMHKADYLALLTRAGEWVQTHLGAVAITLVVTVVILMFALLLNS